MEKKKREKINKQVREDRAARRTAEIKEGKSAYRPSVVHRTSKKDLAEGPQVGSEEIEQAMEEDNED